LQTPHAEIKTPHAEIANAARGDWQRRTRKLKRRLRRFPARHKKSRSILTDEAAFIIAI